MQNQPPKPARRFDDPRVGKELGEEASNRAAGGRIRRAQIDQQDACEVRLVVAKLGQAKVTHRRSTRRDVDRNPTPAGKLSEATQSVVNIAASGCRAPPRSGPRTPNELEVAVRPARPVSREPRQVFSATRCARLGGVEDWRAKRRLRFQSPLVAPDMRIARIRRSDEAIMLSPTGSGACAQASG